MSNANALELIMLNLVNGEREAAGLEPLRLITLLNEAAEDHSAWMLDADQFSHQGEGGSTPTERMDAAGYPFEGSYMSAENIGWQSARGAESFEDDVEQIHEGLMASPGHRANILDPNAEDIGIGIEVGTFSGAGGDYEAVMATQVFGRTEADISAWVDPQTGAEDDVEPPVIPEEPEDPEIPDAEDQPMDDGDDPVAEEPTPDAPIDDDVAMEDCPVEEDTVTEDETEEDEEVVAENDDPSTEDDQEEDVETEDDNEQDDPYDDGSESDDDDVDVEDGLEEDEDMPDEDVVENEDDGEDEDDGDIEETPVEMPAPSMPLPCDLSQFTVDLSGAFEFRQEGDQLIWETSEEKIMEAFQAAFDEWTALMEAPTPDDIETLMLEDFEDMPGCMMEDEVDAANDWLLSDCA